jgi:hypothetical protein
MNSQAQTSESPSRECTPVAGGNLAGQAALIRRRTRHKCHGCMPLLNLSVQPLNCCAQTQECTQSLKPKRHRIRNSGGRALEDGARQAFYARSRTKAWTCEENALPGATTRAYKSRTRTQLQFSRGV